MARPRLSPALIRRALVRSRIKLRILFALLDLEEATLADLAREARAKPAHVRGAIFGDGVAFRRSTALARIQLVRIEDTYVDERARLTARGKRVARAWRAETTRATLGLPRHPHA
jgi:predicted transcriptional regulator with HTH domain